MPIVINNTQATSTGSNFDQLIVVNSSWYTSWEQTNLLNVIFFTGTGAVVTSWLESGSSNVATRTIYWLSLSSGVSGGSTTTVYMGFGNVTTTRFMTGLLTGEAPQLSKPYASLDNGLRVFSHYENFNSKGKAQFGTSPSGWYNSGGSGYCNYNYIRNGWGTDGVNGCGTVYTGSDFPISGSVAADLQIVDYQATGSDWQAPFVNSASATSYSAQGKAVQWSDQSASCNSFNTAAKLQVVKGPGGTAVANATSNPQMILTVTNSSVLRNYHPVMHATGLLAPAGYLATAVYTSSYCGSSMYGHWIRTRALPPAGVMPTATAGRSVFT